MRGGVSVCACEGVCVCAKGELVSVYDGRSECVRVCVCEEEWCVCVCVYVRVKGRGECACV